MPLPVRKEGLPPPPLPPAELLDFWRNFLLTELTSPALPILLLEQEVSLFLEEEEIDDDE